MLEDIVYAFQEIWRHKMRSFLTMLGVIIGIASIIAIVSTIKGTAEQIKEELLGSGKNTVEIKLNDGDSEYTLSQDEAGRETSIMTEDIKKRSEVWRMWKMQHLFMDSREEKAQIFTIKMSV